MVRSRAASRFSSPSTGSPRIQPPHPRLQPLQSPSPRLGFPGLSWASWASSESSASSMHVLLTPSSQRQDYESLVPVLHSPLAPVVPHHLPLLYKRIRHTPPPRRHPPRSILQPCHLIRTVSPTTTARRRDAACPALVIAKTPPSHFLLMSTRSPSITWFRNVCVDNDSNYLFIGIL